MTNLRQQHSPSGIARLTVGLDGLGGLFKRILCFYENAITPKNKCKFLENRTSIISAHLSKRSATQHALKR